MKKMLPQIVKDRIHLLKTWVNQQIGELSVNPKDVDEFVQLITALEDAEEHYDEYRERLALNESVWKICEDFGFPTGEDKQSRFVEETFLQMNRLKQQMYDTKERSDKRKEEMKKKIAQEVPLLNQRVEALDLRINDERYLHVDPEEVENNVIETLESLTGLQKEFDGIADMKRKIQNYQKTLDMGKIESFNNVEESKILLGHRSKLWQSLFDWRQNTKIWEYS
jgi:hypothetical protein